MILRSDRTIQEHTATAAGDTGYSLVEILAEYRDMLAAHPAFEPVRPVRLATVHRRRPPPG